MAAKPIKSLELHYIRIQFLIGFVIRYWKYNCCDTPDAPIAKDTQQEIKENRFTFSDGKAELFRLGLLGCLE